jgi:transposase-like protein
MSNRYESNEKAAAMALVERNRGNVQLTAQQMGIPERTIQSWLMDIRPYMHQFAPAREASAVETPVFANDLEALAFIRQNIIGELSRLSASLQHDAGFSTPYQRALVMSQLMDKMMKLDVHLKPYMQETEEIVVFEGENDYDDDESVGDDPNAAATNDIAL